MDTSSDHVRELRTAIGDDAVQDDQTAIVRMLRDNSWLSPVLTEQAKRRVKAEGPTLGVSAVVRPKSEEDVRRVCELAVASRTPITPRGSGTTNFGLVTPERGGWILDLRALRDEPTIEEGGVRAPAGTLHGKMEELARGSARELALLTTTHTTATSAGWVVGGHVGLGSSVHGTVWDDIVQELRVVTAEDNPRILTLTGHDTFPLLHTFGAFGVVTEVVLRSEPAHDWMEAIAFFPTFEVAAQFVRELSLDSHFAHRVVTAQEESIMGAFKQLAPVMQTGNGVLMIVDKHQVDEIERVATSMGGTFAPWQEWSLGPTPRPSIATMVYGHRMLWVKRAYPNAAFLHVYFNPKAPDDDVRALKQQFGDGVIVEMKYLRSPWMSDQLGFDPVLPVPASVITICDGDDPDALPSVMRFCEAHGIQYQNPHTGVVEDNGLISDIDRLVAFKNEVDPYNLLNPGKVRSAN